jgi:hypothetical protein
LPKLGLFVRCFPLDLSCLHLHSEYVEVEGIDMLDMEGKNMLEEHERPWNQRLGVEGMDMMEERPSKERLEVEGIDTEEEHPMNERSEMEGMDMVEEMTTEVVKREHEGVVLVKHWIDVEKDRHR